MLSSPSVQASQPLGCCSFPWSEESGSGHPAAFLTPFLSHSPSLSCIPLSWHPPWQILTVFKQTKNCVIWIQDGFLYKDNILNSRSRQGLKQLTILPSNICMLNTVDPAGFFFSRDNSIFLYCLCLSHPRGGSIFGSRNKQPLLEVRSEDNPWALLTKDFTEGNHHYLKVWNHKASNKNTPRVTAFYSQNFHLEKKNAGIQMSIFPLFPCFRCWDHNTWSTHFRPKIRI